MKLTVLFDNRQDAVAVDAAMRALVRRALRAALKYEGFARDAEVSVSFVSDDEIHALNKEYRDTDRATDVLSFPMFDEDAADGEAVQLGDIVISLEHARDQGEKFGHGLTREVGFLSVHSMLHLLGYDHETSPDDDLDMRRRQSEIMKTIGLEIK